MKISEEEQKEISRLIRKHVKAVKKAMNVDGVFITILKIHENGSWTINDCVWPTDKGPSLVNVLMSAIDVVINEETLEKIRKKMN